MGWSLSQLRSGKRQDTPQMSHQSITGHWSHLPKPKWLRSEEDIGDSVEFSILPRKEGIKPAAFWFNQHLLSSNIYSFCTCFIIFRVSGGLEQFMSEYPSWCFSITFCNFNLTRSDLVTYHFQHSTSLNSFSHTYEQTHTVPFNLACDQLFRKIWQIVLW